MLARLALFYRMLVFDKPWSGIALILLLVLLAATQAPKFRLDASADSLVLENDADLTFFRQMSKRYAAADFLFIAFRPDGDVLGDVSLALIDDMQTEIETLQAVESVTSVLNVPLIDSPRVSFTSLAQGMRTLKTPGVDKTLALKEFTSSPLYQNLLMSEDGKTTALQINIKRDSILRQLLSERDLLREKKWNKTITAEEQQQLQQAELMYRQYSAQYQQQQKQFIQQIRNIMDNYRTQEGVADLYLGGISMIASDMTDFISRDIKTFGSAILIFLILVLGVIFRQLRWVVLPLMCCFISVFVMIGLIGLMDWPITVISSNFTSLLLIMTMSLTIHLIVRYRELHQLNPGWPQKTLVAETISQMSVPCFYTSITTIVAFLSLIFSGIRPVIDFGFTMVAGICVAFSLSFILFPAVASLLKARQKMDKQDFTNRVSAGLAAFTERYSKRILLISVILLVLGLVGISRLEVENRFIDYFKESTEIYQGMVLIDKELGGTTPLDIVIKPDAAFLELLNTSIGISEADEFDALFDDESPTEDDADFDILAAEGSTNGPNYWFNQRALARLERVHDYLDNLPQVGKVLSLATAMRLVTMVNNDQPLDDLELAVLRAKLPDVMKKPLFDPYVTEDGNEVRISMRVIDSDPSLRRNQLLQKIAVDLKTQFGFELEQYRASNMLVLYNNMLQSLFRSQILTLGVVMLCILIMFILLFRSLLLSIVAVVPNLFAATVVIGLMGWLAIPLDLMSITIAAISVGIGVDNAIHYIVRYRLEFAKDGDYEACVRRSHATIGKGIYFTNLTVIAGFSILVLSSFIPTIYFGLLTALAMFVALLANLILLPRLLVVFKPLY